MDTTNATKIKTTKATTTKKKTKTKTTTNTHYWRLQFRKRFQMVKDMANNKQKFRERQQRLGRIVTAAGTTALIGGVVASSIPVIVAATPFAIAGSLLLGSAAEKRYKKRR